MLIKQKLPITTIIAVKNEEKNLDRCLKSLSPVDQIIIIDSHSTDNTQNIALNFEAQIYQFDYKGGYPKKRQWALDNIPINTEWVLLLDADEVIPDDLWTEISSTITSAISYDAYLITKGFHFLNKRLRFGGFSHSAVLLFRKGKANFEKLFDDNCDGLDMEVHERIVVDGKIGKLNAPLIHNDFKGLQSYIDRHNKYSTWESQLRYNFIKSKKYGLETIAPNIFGNSQERRRALKSIIIRLPFESLIWFLFHYVIRLGFLEGKRGYIASKIRSNYISEVKHKIYELKIKEKTFHEAPE